MRGRVRGRVRVRVSLQLERRRDAARRALLAQPRLGVCKGGLLGALQLGVVLAVRRGHQREAVRVVEQMPLDQILPEGVRRRVEARVRVRG